MSVRIAVVGNSTKGFAPAWSAALDRNGLTPSSIDKGRSDFLSVAAKFDAVMWHLDNGDLRDRISGRQQVGALEAAGVKVYPSYDSVWTYDDKVSQAWIMRALGICHPDTWVFLDRGEAASAASRLPYPVVWKQSHGSGSRAVQLVRTRTQALRLIKRAFGRGFAAYDMGFLLRDRVRGLVHGESSMVDVAKMAVRVLIPPHYVRLAPPEKGYLYLQEFIPDRRHDFRVKLVGDRVWGYQRTVRAGDFRASGGQQANYYIERDALPPPLRQLSRELRRRLKMNTVAFDFLERDGEYLLLEFSAFWGFSSNQHEVGYWNESDEWVVGSFNPFDWMVEDLLLALRSR
jgi:glutathione synthase/RimK-type ligase-like ATP-grasp enzyme